VCVCVCVQGDWEYVGELETQSDDVHDECLIASPGTQQNSAPPRVRCVAVVCCSGVLQ